MEFKTNVDVRWADVDQNQHVRHSVYYDYGAHTRMKFLEHLGYDAHALFRMHLGPILFHEQCHFIKELKMKETITINLLKGKMKEDGSQWTLHHEIFNGQGDKSAHITVKGAWMDIVKRKIIAPPPELHAQFSALGEGDEYVRS